MFFRDAGIRCGAILKSRQIKPFWWRDSACGATLDRVFHLARARVSGKPLIERL